jgi:NDP-sugar pyrophosphorylase family protein
MRSVLKGKRVCLGELVSSDRSMTSYATDSRCCLAGIDVFVIAGGLGTRIRPVLGDVPKLLAPISGRPYLSYLLDWLQRFGAARVVLGLGHQAQPVIDFLGADSRWQRVISVETVIEPHPLGTAGAIRFARQNLRSDPVLVLNGDSFADVDLCKFVEFHRQARPAVTLLCAEVEDASRYGRVEVDGRRRIKGFVEKDPHFHGGSLVSAGVYLFSATVLDEIAGGKASSLEHEVFANAPPGSLAAFSGKFPFIDIGTPESLAAAVNVIGNHASTG